MKAIYALLALAIVCTQATAQDFCKLVKKDVQNGNTFDFTSPFNPEEIPALRVSRSYVTGVEEPTDNFYIIFYMLGDLESVYTTGAGGEQIEKEEKKLVVEFDDKTTYVDEDIQINHDLTTDKLSAVRYVYLNMTDKNLGDFTTKKIAKFSLAGFQQVVPADSANAMMHYVECIRAAKK